MKISMIYVSFKNLLTKEWPEHRQSVKVIFCDVIGCSIGVYTFIVFKSSIEIFYIPNEPSAYETSPSFNEIPSIINVRSNCRH